MGKGRVQGFGDGVIAIIVTSMVLELKVPPGADLAALRPLIPVFLGYLLSFTFVGIYWNNHHHLLHAVQGVNGNILWANLFLLFCLSLVPFVTAWMRENHFSTIPVAIYGVVLLLCAIAFTILARLLVAHHGQGSTLAKAIGSDQKGKISLLLYAVAIPLAFVHPRLSLALYVTVSVIWFLPDRRIERLVAK